VNPTLHPDTARRHPSRLTAALLALCATPLLITACRPSPSGDAVGDGASTAITATLGADASGSITPPAGAAATGAVTSTAAAMPTTAEHLTAEDEAAMISLIRTLFGPVTGSAEPDMQDTIVRQISTIQLRALRGEEGPTAGVYGYSAGLVWIVGFKTSAPLTLSTFAADESTLIDLKDLGPTASLAGPDGKTSVYYIVSTQSVEGDRRFVPMSQGVLVEGKSKWTLDDLAKLPATP
jgi:hypothetical protein